MLLLSLCSLLLLCLNRLPAALAQVDGFPTTINMISDLELDKVFLEIGFVSLNVHTWTSITTTVDSFNSDGDKVLSAFFSLPEYGDGVYDPSFPMVPKMNGRPVKNGDGTYTFEGILVMPDDAECKDDWWVPVDPGIISVPWMIVEQGAYNLSNNFFLISEGNITRNVTDKLKSDSPPHYPEQSVVMNFTTGCDQANPEERCMFPAFPGTTPPYPLKNYKDDLGQASLQQLQTSYRKANQTHIFGGYPDVNNTNPDPKELFVSVRGVRIYRNRAQYIIATHGILQTELPELFNEYQSFTEPELLAFFIFQKSVRIRCTEGLVIETEIFFQVNSSAMNFEYATEFTAPPGLFAMLGSVVSASDATILRSFDRTRIGSSFITQEDQCADSDLEHEASERAFAFVVGESEAPVTDGETVVNCFALFKYDSPTSEPSGQPSGQPSGEPSGQPSQQPSGEPSGQPSGQPSGHPSSSPSDVPSGEPSAEPSNAPSEVPSCVPSSEPSSPPTKFPTRFPTTSPTPRPSPTPTFRPTVSPSMPSGNCTFNFLLFDLFGDGFYNIYANFTTTRPRDDNSTSYFHQPNCTAKVVSVFSETCSIDVSMLTLDGSDPLLAWEAYWVLNFKGETYIGGVEALLSIEFGEVTFSRRLVDYSVPGTGVNKCHECPHPPPHNANTPPGVCESSLTAKPCPPIVGKGKEGGKGKAAGKGKGKGSGKRALHEGDDDSDKDDDHSDKDDDSMGYNSTDGRSGKDDDHSDKDDDSMGYNSTGTDDDHSDKDDDHSDKDDDFMGYNSTGTDDDHSDKDDDYMGYNSTGTDDDHSDKDDDHINYGRMPKPKPKPPYLVYINMYDELKNGYLDKSDDWSDYFNTAELVGTGGEYSELDAAILVPNIMVYPKYYLMTKDRKKLIKPPKSICSQNRGTEYCEEALPWHGHFIFRFAGIEPSDPSDEATWSFCGVTGGINEEFEFIMRNGECYPLTNKLSAAAYCEYGFETAISMSGAFTISGDFTQLDELSELDTRILEKELSLHLPGELKVVVDSVTHEADTLFTVFFKVKAVAESVGYDGSQADKVETMMYEFESTLSNSLESGELLTSVWRDLDAIPGTQSDVLRLSSTMQLAGNMQIEQLTFQDRRAGVSAHTGEIGGSWSSSRREGEGVAVVSSSSEGVPAEEGVTGMVSLGVVLVGVGLSALVAAVIKLPSFGEFGAGLDDRGEGGVLALGGDSDHCPVHDTQIEECSDHDTSEVAMDSSRRPLVDFSLSNVEAGHRAVHYVEDIDATLFAKSQQHYEHNEAGKRSFI